MSSKKPEDEAHRLLGGGLARGFSAARRALGIRLQLVLFFLAAFGSVFTVFSVGVYLYIAREHRQEFDATLYNYVVDLSHSMSNNPAVDTDRLLSLPVSSEMILPFPLGEALVQVAKPSGEVLMKSPSLGTQELPRAPIAISQKGVFQDIHYHRHRALDVSTELNRLRMVSHPFERDGVQYVIQAAAPMVFLDRQEESLLFFLAITVPLILGIAGATGHAFSRRAMAPVALITRTANEIEARHLSERIPVPECRDEICELAITLNGLLDRLEIAFRSQEAFIADASHQLRTPLAILKGEFELFRKNREAGRNDEVDDLVQSALQEVSYLNRMVEDLLLLARADSEQIECAGHLFRLDEKILECVSRLTLSASQRGIDLSLNLHSRDEQGPSFEMVGDPELARSLVENLVENAIKYSSKAGKVHIDLNEFDDRFELQVRDEGPGIPQDAFPHLYSRFFRAESTRNTVPGSGLGLAIVKRVAGLYGGKVSAINDERGGALFSVVLPRPASGPDTSENRSGRA